MASLSRLASRSRSLHRPTPGAFIWIILAGPALLGVSRALPDTGLGLAVRLVAAATCVLLLPGALAQRVFAWPSQLGVALAGAFVWSLGIITVALGITFLVGASLSLTVGLVGVAASVAFVPALWARHPTIERPDRYSVIGLAGIGLALGVAVWWVAETVEGDALFHVARVRKLDELSELPSVSSLNEFVDGGLHPGYAFPVWHGALALVARFAAVDAAAVVQFLPALLVPLALVFAYAAGVALFRSWAGGLATAAAQAGLVAFSRDGIGSFGLLSLPPAAARLLITPALLAVAFALLAGAPRRTLVVVGLGGLALAIVHPTYVLYVALGLAGFAVARVVLARREGLRDAGYAAASIVAMLVPAGIYFAWLLPVVRQTASFRPDEEEVARGTARYADQLDLFGDAFRLAPDSIARGGVVAVVGLVAIGLLILVPRWRATAYVVGASLVMLIVLLVPVLFTALSDAVSLSQSRRLPAFLPVPLAFAAGALLVGRLRLFGVAIAAGLGVVLVVLSAGENVGWLSDGGFGWAAWVGLAGAVVVLAFGRFVRQRVEGHAAELWVALAALAFVAPVAVDGLRQLEQEPADPRALSPGLVEAIRAEVPARAVVFADLETSYRIAAAAPVSIAAAPPAHVADTRKNRPYERRSAVVLFFFRDVPDAARIRVLRRFDAEWLVVDKERAVPALVSELGSPSYEDERWLLYRVPAELIS